LPHRRRLVPAGFGLALALGSTTSTLNIQRATTHSPLLPFPIRIMSLRSSWTVRHAAGEPLAVVRVRNLQTTVVGPQDAWGRPKLQQPLLVSAELHFSRPFASAAAADNVTSGDTVHYGELSKLILACVDRSNDHAAMEGAPNIDLRVLLEMIWIVLTGRNIDGTDAEPEAAPLLDRSRLRFISLTVSLPKASLLGEAVSLTASNVYAPFTVGPSALSMYGLCLRIHKLRVPTLIGVNPNERKARQFVVVDVEVDKLDYYPDIYCELENILVQVLYPFLHVQVSDCLLSLEKYKPC
jgi:dihydroneopterin aldolase